MQNDQIVRTKEFTQQLDRCSDSGIITLFWQNIFAEQSGDAIFSEFLRNFSPFNSSPSKEVIGDLLMTMLLIKPTLQIRNLELALFADKRMRIRIDSLAQPIKTLVFYIIQHAKRYFSDVRDTFGIQNIVLLNCKYPMPLRPVDILGFYMATVSKLCTVNAPVLKLTASNLYSTIVNYLLQRLLASTSAHAIDWFTLFKTHCPREPIISSSIQPSSPQIEKKSSYFF